jgi:hypothetical protein
MDRELQHPCGDADPEDRGSGPLPSYRNSTLVLRSVSTSPSSDSRMTRPDGDRGVEAMQVRGDHLLLFVAVAI